MAKIKVYMQKLDGQSLDQTHFEIWFFSSSISEYFIDIWISEWEAKSILVFLSSKST